MIKKIKEKVSAQLIANLVSFGIMAVCGLLFNILIGRFFGVENLGVFNQVWSVYILLSQISVWGIHLSLLRQSSVDRAMTDAGKMHLASGMFLILLLSLAVGGVAFLLSAPLEYFYSSKATGDAWSLVVPGLILFSLNKGLLAIVNGMNLMIWFAVAQATRYLLMLATVLFMHKMGMDGKNVSICFTISELGVFIILLPSLRHFVVRINKSVFIEGLKQHWRFGSKTMVGGAFLEFNSKIDVLILGFFASDVNVGVYSFVATIVEGISQISVVFRNLINPKIALLAAKGQGAEIYKMGKSYFLPSVFLYSLLSIVLYSIFPYVVEHLTGHGNLMEGRLSLAILLVGAILASPFLPFYQVFTQSNRPGGYSLFQGLNAITTLILNLILVPALGVVGAALGASISMGLSGFWLLLIAKKFLLFESHPKVR